MSVNGYEPVFSFADRALGPEKVIAIMNEYPFMPITSVVYEVIAAEIVHFRFLPERVIVVSSLADQLGVSRTPVRMALAQLEKDGLVYMTDSKKYAVSRFNQEEYLNAFTLRVELEAGAIRLAAKNICKKEISELSEIHKKLKLAYQSKDWDGITNGENAFHKKLVECSHNDFFISAYRSIGVQLRRYRIYLIFDISNYVNINKVHGMIIRALETGSADLCEEAIRAHFAIKPLSYENDVKKVFEELKSKDGK